MKVVIINCFDTYSQRVELLHNYFSGSGHEVTILESNFKHFQKSTQNVERLNYILIETKSYYKNLSFSRLNSHYNFSKQAFKKVEEIEPDMLYILLPPNSLAKFANMYKKRNEKVKVYFDLIDLWPETFPIGIGKKNLLFMFWSKLRDNNLNAAEVIFTECDYYQTTLKKTLINKKAVNLYLAKTNSGMIVKPIQNNDIIQLCYLGSINNIIDISLIKTILKTLNKYKPVILHIIGDGEKREEMIREIEKEDIKVKYHGEIYSAKAKIKIFNQCHFGLNIMKENVLVGLTMKSIDYFESGLPILNNIKGDTKELVMNKKIGYNISYSNINKVSEDISKLEIQNFNEFKRNTLELFDDFFSVEAFNSTLNTVFK